MTLSRFYRSLFTLTFAALTAASALALTQDYYATSSVLSSGNWVKIRIAETGIHEITSEQLIEWGFSDPTKVTVWGYGSTALADNTFSTDKPDDLVPMKTYWETYKKRLMFYGVAGIDLNVNSNTAIERKTNHTSKYGYYFLTDSREATTFSPISYSAASTSLLTHTAMEYYENDAVNLTAGGTYFFSENIINNPQTYNFNLRNLSVSTSFRGTLIYSFATPYIYVLRLGVDPVTDLYSFETSALAKTPSVSYDVNCKFITASASVPLSYNSSSSATNWGVTFSVPLSIGAEAEFAGLDYVAMLYPSSNDVSGVAQMTMYFTGVSSSSVNFRLSNTVSNTQVWNVNDPTKVRAYQLVRDSNSITASLGSAYPTGSPAAKVVVFNPNMQQKGVEYVSHLTAQNLHGEAVPDMLIVTTHKLKAQAERLAQIHRDRQGFDVKVVTPDVVYNEFSSGTPMPGAIRRYAKMLYDRDPAKFRFILFMGTSTWDPRGITRELLDEDFLPAYEAESLETASYISKCFASDAWFGMLADDFQNSTVSASNHLYYAPMLVNVGRLPYDNATEAAAAIDKIADYFENPPVMGSYNRALLSSDDGDGNAHLTQSDSVAVIINRLAPAVTVTKVYNALYPWEGKNPVAFRNAVSAGLALGQGYFGYVGHGRADRLGANELLWGLSDIDNNHYSVMPFVMLSTCDSYTFDRVVNDIVARMVRVPSGGCLNAVGACRSVYKPYNQIINMAVANAYFSAQSGTFSGDIYRLGRNDAASQAFDPANPSMSRSALGINTLCYNFAGDPALPLYIPTLNVVTNTIDGAAVTDNSATPIYPLKPFTLAGAITDAAGNVLSDFNGRISIDIYDGPTTITSSGKGETPTSDVRDVDLDETLLAQYVTTVTNGRFEANMVVPASVRPNLTNRVSYFAVNDDHSLCASGVFRGAQVVTYDAAQVQPDVTGPVISEFYLDDPSFVTGDEVSGSPTAYVTIESDPSGLNVSGGKIGVGTKLVLDHTTNYTSVAQALQLTTDGRATIEFPLSDITDGTHTLTISVADNAGNRSEQTISFTVVNRLATVLLDVEETPARTEATLTLSHNFPGDATGRLVIEDAGGESVFTASIPSTATSFPFTWDLKDSRGFRVADGHYRAYVVLHSGNRYGSSEKIDIVVIE